MTSFMNQTVISVVIAIVLFLTINPTLSLYTVFFIATWILISINFSVFKNREFYQKIFWISLFVSLVPYAILAIRKEKIIKNTYDQLEVFLISLVLLAVLTALAVSYLDKVINRSQTKDKQPEMIPKRAKDLQSLMKYLDAFEIVGVNGRWGTGKTFLVNRLKERVKDEYEFIEIDLLTSNLNEMQLALITGFEEVLAKNEILPKHAQKLKKTIDSSSLLGKVHDAMSLIFENSESKSEIIKAFQDEVGKLDKKVLVIYEDMDRILDKQVIREIFSISEKIANDRIKIIYQYDEAIMTQEVGFEYDYLEKYIPFKMNLTELDFQEALQFELQMNPESLLEMDDFEFLKNQNQSFNILTERFNMNKEFIFELKNTPFRKVKQLVSEIELAFATKRNLYEKNKNIVIGFFILKHLRPHVYEKLSSNRDLIEALKFKKKDDDKQYTMSQLIEKNDIDSELKKDVFKIKENRENYRAFKLLGYEIYKGYSENVRQEVEEKNRKINQVIWNLLYEGESSLTDYEHMVEQFIEQVFEQPYEEKKDAWFYYLNHLGDFWDSERWIYRKPDLRDIFKGFRLVNEEEKYQEELIDLYFRYSNQPSEFNLEVIQCMNLCPIYTKNRYLKVIQYINKLDIVRNFNSDSDFGEFLSKYIRELEKFHYGSSYANYFTANDLAAFEKSSKEKLIHDIETDKKRLKEFLSTYEEEGFTNIIKEYEDIILFLEKMIQVIQTKEKVVTTKGSEIISTIEVRENKRLKELRELYESNPTEGKKQIMEAYEKEELTLAYIDSIFEIQKLK